ncbi:MAG: DUF1080 domain-containing protein [Abditibacteriales bacterium]|nr:DUF1080 domain-containing protein [Abditibacteriales bacterium]MDW8366307.1 DUF1080 domain-containing protein [Abditibacteriales bacterium]
MKRRQRLLSVMLAAAIFGAITARSDGDTSEVGFVPIFNGKDFTGIKFFNVTESTYTIRDGVLMCSGKPNGYWYTEKSYKNYILRFEWRYKRPEGLQNDADFRGNSGYLIHITGEHRLWPKCLEVQGMNRDAGIFLPLGGVKINHHRDDAAKRAAIRPVGEWNEMEILSLNGTIISRINGQVIAFGTDCDVRSGPIGFQSEGAEIHWRNVRIKELPE